MKILGLTGENTSPSGQLVVSNDFSDSYTVANQGPSYPVTTNIVTDNLGKVVLIGGGTVAQISSDYANTFANVNLTYGGSPVTVTSSSYHPDNPYAQKFVAFTSNAVLQSSTMASTFAFKGDTTAQVEFAASNSTGMVMSFGTTGFLQKLTWSNSSASVSSITGSSGNWGPVVWTGNQFVAHANTSTSVMKVSANVQTVLGTTTSSLTGSTSMASNGSGIIISVNGSNTYTISNDHGNTWSFSSFPAGKDPNRIKFVRGMWLAFSTNIESYSYVYSIDDGYSWNTVTGVHEWSDLTIILSRYYHTSTINQIPSVSTRQSSFNATKLINIGANVHLNSITTRLRNLMIYCQTSVNSHCNNWYNVSSIDASNFTTSTTNRSFKNRTWSMTYSGSKWIGVKLNSMKRVVSTDGVTWTAGDLPLTASWCAISTNGTYTVAIAADTDTAIRTTDGVTWTTHSLPATRKWRSLTYGNGKFVAVAHDSDKGAYSTDGATWTECTLPATANWNTVIYGERFLAVSDSTIGATSTDGVTWTQVAFPDTTRWQSAAYLNGDYLIVGVGTGSDYYPASITGATSTDATNWTTVLLGAWGPWTSVGVGVGDPDA